MEFVLGSVRGGMERGCVALSARGGKGDVALWLKLDGMFEREVLVRRTMPYATALFSFGLADRGRLVKVQSWCGVRLSLAAVVAAFAGWLPGDWGKGALEEGVVDDVALAIFSFDDPIAGIGFALAGIGEDQGGVKALRGVYEKGSAGAEGVHRTLLSALLCVADRIYFST